MKTIKQLLINNRQTRSNISDGMGCPEDEENTNEPISATPLLSRAFAAAAEKSNAMDSCCNKLVRPFSDRPTIRRTSIAYKNYRLNMKLNLSSKMKGVVNGLLYLRFKFIFISITI